MPPEGVIHHITLTGRECSGAIVSSNGASPVPLAHRSSTMTVRQRNGFATIV